MRDLIRKGEISDARCIAQLAGRRLTKEEYEFAENRQLARGDYEMVLDRAIRKKAIDRAKGNKVFQLALAKGDYRAVKKIARLLKRRITKEQLLHLLENKVNKGDLRASQEVAAALGQKLDVSQLRTILGVFLKVKRNRFTSPAIDVARLLGNALTLGEAKSIMKRCLRKGDLWDIFEAAELVGREPTDKELEAAIADDLRLGMVELADGHAQKYLGRPVTVEEKVFALSQLVKRGYLHGAVQVAAKLGRHLTDAEVQTILSKKQHYPVVRESQVENVRDHLTEAQIQRVILHLAEHGHLQELQAMRGSPADRGELDHAWSLAVKSGNPYCAYELSKLTGESITAELAEQLLRSAIRRGFIGCLVEVANLAGREVTVNEVRKAVRNSVRRKQRKSK